MEGFNRMESFSSTSFIDCHLLHELQNSMKFEIFNKTMCNYKYVINNRFTIHLALN